MHDPVRRLPFASKNPPRKLETARSSPKFERESDLKQDSLQAVQVLFDGVIDSLSHVAVSVHLVAAGDAV